MLEAEETESESIHHWATVAAITGLAATLIIGQALHRRHIYRVPEAAVGVLIGMLLGGLASLTGSAAMAEEDRFDAEFFMVWLLPPIIFAAGYNMDTASFFDNIGPTMIFAFGGTLLSTCVVGGVVYLAGQLELCYPLGRLPSLFFGCIISATDPVTVLAVLKAIGVRSDIFAIIFGESVLNDAVAIVLARTILAFRDPTLTLDAAALLGAALSFCLIFVGSMVIGIAAGAASALLFKGLALYERGDQQVLEAAVAFAFPWAAYYASEALELSGIVTILFTGIVMATYARCNLSEAAVALTRDIFDVLALAAETFVFNYLGMAFFTFPHLSKTASTFAGVALIGCFLGRLQVFVGSSLVNCSRGRRFLCSLRGGLRGSERAISGYRMPLLTGRQAFMFWFSGLRGGVAFALAAGSFGARHFPDHCSGARVSMVSVEDLAAACGSATDGLVILQATLLIAVFTIVVFGSSVRDVAFACDVVATPNELSDGPSSLPAPPRRIRWRALSKRYIEPRLTRSDGYASRLHEKSATPNSRAPGPIYSAHRTRNSEGRASASNCLLSTPQAAWSTELVMGSGETVDSQRSEEPPLPLAELSTPGTGASDSRA